MRYNVFYLSEWELTEPVYYFVDQVEASSSRHVFDDHLVYLARKVREWMNISEDALNDARVAQRLYLVREENWLLPSQTYQPDRVGSS